MAGKISGGALKVLAGVTLFSFGGITAKWMPWSAITLVGVRSLFATCLLAAARGSFKASWSKANVLAGLCVALTSILFIISTKLTTAANAIVLQYAMPVIVIILSAVVYRQRPTRRDIVTSACVFAGVALCFAGSLGNGDMLGDMLALMSAGTYAIVFFAARLPGCSPSDYTLIGNMVNIVFAVNLFFDPAVSLAPGPWAVALFMGVCLGGGYALLSAGMRDTPPTQAAIISNVEPVLNPLWVFLALGEKPSLTSLIGAAVVLTTVTMYSVNGRRQAAEGGKGK